MQTPSNETLLTSVSPTCGGTFRAQTIERLASVLEAPLPRRLISAFSQVDPPLPSFSDGSTLIRFQRDRTADKALKSSVLGVLLADHLANPSESRAFDLLFAAMFPVVERRFWNRVWKARSEVIQDGTFGESAWMDETWAIVVEIFVGVVRNYPIERRPRKYAGNILGLVLHGIDDHELQDDRNAAAQRWMEQVIAKISDPDEVSVFDATEDEEAPAELSRQEISDLDRWLEDHGLESRLDRAVMIAIDVQKRASADVAHELGVTDRAVRSRIVEARIRLRQAPQIRRIKRRRNFSQD